MTRFLAILVALTCAASAQTYRTVTADTNNVIRTNFTLAFPQVTFAGGSSNSVPVVSGGTGATNAAGALVNLLPSYTGNSNAVLALNSNATGLIWTTNAGGGLPETPLSVTNGGTGGTNRESALLGLSIFETNSFGLAINLTGGDFVVLPANGIKGILIGENIDSTTTNNTQMPIAIGVNNIVRWHGVSIGRNAWSEGGQAIGNNSYASGLGVAIGDGAFVNNAFQEAASNNYGGVAIGYGAVSQTNGGAAVGRSAYTEGGGAVGNSAYTKLGGAVGRDAHAFDGFAGGYDSFTRGGVALGVSATSTNGFQIGTGTNAGSNTIQFMSAGQITTNEWAALANAGTIGTNVLRSTNAADAQAAIFPATTTNAPTNTNAPTPDAWLDVTVGTNLYKLPLWQ